ncbi:hypothetical protein [Roseibium suaedae]|uniref:Uncharacterized protein n=1 Tax=Roseibium suaedae TaxID=735517 RepID=A0A1M7H987_9HYPH|nr:hypothetical protein [Roseibium suaedae]SHM24959.1 hypothetical protein SAMN05444272_2145 [Roseibium suaedae]
MASSNTAGLPLVVRILLRVPVLNLFLKDAIHGEESAKYWFIGNLFMIWMLCIYLIGYPAIIIPALFMVVVAFLWILETCR